jgi:hypothetical protein
MTSSNFISLARYSAATSPFRWNLSDRRAETEQNINDFNIDIHDFNNNIIIISDIYYSTSIDNHKPIDNHISIDNHKPIDNHISIDNQHHMVTNKSILREIQKIFNEFKNNQTINNTRRLDFYTYYRILLNRTKNQLIGKKCYDMIITKIAGKETSVYFGHLINNYIEPVIDNIDCKIKLFESIEEVIGAFIITKIKFTIEEYFSEKLSIDSFRNKIEQINIPSHLFYQKELIKNIITFCNMESIIGHTAFNRGLKNMLTRL